ncbi:MAG: Gfo/Idh/MocA family oxidoreductase [Bryobacterales bacterium]|nr:Gfo/Idh/MocA family oxidoreductase [Bryobacterales bacterium]
MNRRSFLRASAAGVSFVQSGAAASDRINVAMIGVRGQGRHLTGKFAQQKDVAVRYLCDVDENVFDRAVRLVEEKGAPRPRFVNDFRRALDDKDIDAVVIATPDHWHAPATILACDAGKDVYVEKPASHNLREGRLMVEAARRNKRIVQLGTQSRSRPSTIRAIELVRAGEIGKVLMAKAWDVQLREFIGHKNDSTPPPGVDFETWTGPAPFLPFNENRFHYKWHWNWNYGTGDMGNDGVHQIDIARWALGVDLPTEAAGMGRKLHFDDDQQTPDTMNITYTFRNAAGPTTPGVSGDKLLMFELRIWNPYGLEGQDNGVSVYGTTGMMHIGRWNGSWGYRVFDAKGKLALDRSRNEDDADDAHPRNFLDCIKSRRAPNADIETGHHSTVLCHLGNIVARVNRTVKFDPRAEIITGDAEANKLIRREYRKHWATPKGVS